LPHFDEEAIELSAMHRLRDNGLEMHLKQCPECAARVEEHREWIAALKDALLQFALNPIDVITLKQSMAQQGRSYRLLIKL
jgi:anti-sigma factor RsiW